MDTNHDRPNEDLPRKNQSIDMSSSELASSERLDVTKVASKKVPLKLKKNPHAPKRFKSAFIIFSAEKHKEIRVDLANKGVAEKTTNVAKLVSEAWRELSASERAIWEEKARKDKVRYQAEKAVYKGPWQVPNQRRQKDPLAPKRPMSAFLAFSNSRRALIKKSNQNATNADISKALSKMWKEAPEDLRQKYFGEEAALRQDYKIRIEEWRKKAAKEEKAERQEREDFALRTAEAKEGLPSASSEDSVKSPGASAAIPRADPPDGPTEPVLANLQQLQNEMRQSLMNNPHSLSNSLGIGSSSHLHLARHSDLRDSIPGIGGLLGPLSGFHHSLDNLNAQDRAQLSRISDTYQSMFLPLRGDDHSSRHLSGLRMAQDQHHTLASLSARLMEGMQDEPNHNISDYLRSSTNRMYPGYGMGSSLGLGGASHEGINLQNFSASSGGQAATSQNAADVFSMILQQQQAGFGNGPQNSSQRPPSNYGNLPGRF